MIHARKRILAAIAMGLSDCAPDALPPPNDPPTNLPAHAVDVDAEAIPSQAPKQRAAKLVCSMPTKLEQTCFPQKSVPSRGENAPSPTPYASWDTNGCFQANEITGSCNGISKADGPFFENGQCCFDVCRGIPAPCGRPLIVQGEARTADVVLRNDWLLPIAKIRDDETLAREWLRDAQMEHASVASFAHLALELMAVGAPSAMVASCHRAALDEARHARTCFALARAFGGGAMGPTALPLAGIEVRCDLIAMAAATTRDSCIGETLAAMALFHAAEACDNPIVARLLREMADDELRHAELGYAIVAWACKRGGDAVRNAVAEAFAEPVTPSAPVVSDREAWLAAGRLDQTEIDRVIKSTYCEIIDPCAKTVARSEHCTMIYA